MNIFNFLLVFFVCCLFSFVRWLVTVVLVVAWVVHLLCGICQLFHRSFIVDHCFLLCEYVIRKSLFFRSLSGFVFICLLGVCHRLFICVSNMSNLFLHENSTCYLLFVYLLAQFSSHSLLTLQLLKTTPAMNNNYKPKKHHPHRRQQRHQQQHYKHLQHLRQTTKPFYCMETSCKPLLN